MRLLKLIILLLMLLLLLLLLLFLLLLLVVADHTYLVVINECCSLMELMLSLCGGVVVGWWGLHSHFRVQPNYSVEVVLRCCVDGVVTILKQTFQSTKIKLSQRQHNLNNVVGLDTKMTVQTPPHHTN